MPTSEAKPTAPEPTELTTTPKGRVSNGPLHLAIPDDGRPVETVYRGASTSRWADYDTHELLQMISELEDERRWARLREGIWLALLIHILLLLAVILLPKYVFMPRVIDPFDAIKQR